ncbi:MAG: CBS domain-containing protein [Ruminococcaceae bacterium]|nr:CBS domain-containing protein [Oscillospiraceae bacterium]
MTVKDIMTDPAIVITEDASIVEAAKLMRQHNIGSVPVVSGDNNIVGIVTDRDIVIRNMARGLDPKSHSVEEIMTRDVSCVTPETEIDDAAHVMASDKVRRLPVVENERVVGFVALGDISACKDYTFETGEALCEISEGCHKKHPMYNDK